MPRKRTDLMGRGLRKWVGYFDWDEEWDAARFLDEDDVSKLGDDTWLEEAVIA